MQLRVNHFHLRHWKNDGMCICPMHAVCDPIIQTSTVQGYPRSKFIVPIESPLMVCYLTSFKSNTVSLTIFEIFAVKINDLYLGYFKVIQSVSSRCQFVAHGWFPIQLLLTQSLYLSPFSQYLTCNFDDLEVGQFKVIQGQWSWYQSEAHWWFPIWPPLRLTLYLSPYSWYLMRKF